MIDVIVSYGCDVVHNSGQASIENAFSMLFASSTSLTTNADEHDAIIHINGTNINLMQQGSNTKRSMCDVMMIGIVADIAACRPTLLSHMIITCNTGMLEISDCLL